MKPIEKVIVFALSQYLARFSPAGRLEETGARVFQIERPEGVD